MYENFRQYVIEGDKICDKDLYGNKTVIGVTNKAYEDLNKITEEYYNKLVELGVIVPEKTPEQIQQEQNQLMQELLRQIKDNNQQNLALSAKIEEMNKEIEELKNVKSASNSTNDEIKSTAGKQIATSVGTSKQYGQKR
jgi:hypothetical protein